MLSVGGCIQGTLGYLPLYLRGQGWLASRADSAASLFHLASMFFVVPIAVWSDRLGSRRKVLLAAASTMVVGIGALSVAGGDGIWTAVVLVGMVRDGFMGVFITLIIETEGIGATYAGTATGPSTPLRTGLVMGLARSAISSRRPSTRSGCTLGQWAGEHRAGNAVRRVGDAGGSRLAGTVSCAAA
jgi:hypothetical protein